MSGSACNAYQIRKIYAIGGALGMVKRGEDDDLLHELVNGMTGKTSIKELTYGEACKVIGELEGRQGTPPPRKSGRPLHKNVPGRASEGQQRKIWALMYKLQAASPSKAPIGDRLCAIIKKELGIDAVPKNPFAWIDYKGGNKLVEVLKGYVKTAEKARVDVYAAETIYIPKRDSFERIARNKRIVEEYNGDNLKALAKKYNLTTVTIRAIVEDKHREILAKPLDGQLSFFHQNVK